MAYQQAQRWLKAGVFEALVHDRRVLLPMADGRSEQPSAAIMDSRTLQSSPESGARVGYPGAKRKRGSVVHVTVDTLGELLALHVTPANEQVFAAYTFIQYQRVRPCSASHRPDFSRSATSWPAIRLGMRSKRFYTSLVWFDAKLLEALFPP